MIHEYFYHLKNYFVFFLFTHKENLKSSSFTHSANVFFTISYMPGTLLGTEDAVVNKIVPEAHLELTL